MMQKWKEKGKGKADAIIHFNPVISTQTIFSDILLSMYGYGSPFVTVIQWYLLHFLSFGNRSRNTGLDIDGAHLPLVLQF